MKKIKADAENIGGKRSKTYHSSQPFQRSNYSRNNDFGQCLRCRSDYMKFALNGVCQDCQQKVEYIVREHPKYTQANTNGRRSA